MSAKTLQIQLHDPGATWFHDAGVAGLWMTLHQLQEKYPLKTQREGGLGWSLSSDAVHLEWSGTDFEVLDWLFRQSFQTSQEGFIDLSGLKPVQMNTQAQLALHNGITNTFLQHNKFVESNGTDYIVVQPGDPPVKLFYKRLQSYAHQKFAKHLCDDQGDLQREKIGIVGWLYPGLTIRHYAYRRHTQFEETVERSIALLFAPLSCGYFTLPSQAQSSRTPYALVVPAVENLPDFAECRWRVREVTSDSFSATCTNEAALKFLLQEFPVDSRTDSPAPGRCYVILLGTTPWSPQQASRIVAGEITVSQENLNLYQVLQEILRGLKIPGAGQSNISFSNPVRVAISNNLVAGKFWWFNLFEQLQEQNALAESLKYTNLLIEMAERTQWNVEAEKLFIKACHEALRKTYAKVYDRTGEGELARIDRKNQQILGRLNQCHSADRFRSFLADFFAKAGIITVLEEHEEELFPIVRGMTDWRVSRDLFLLAMASYKRKKTSDKNEKVQQPAAVTEDE